MLACRVVLHRGLEVEPEEWLNAVSKSQLQVWKNYYRVEPWGGELELLARILAAVESGLMAEDQGKLRRALDLLASKWLPASWIGQPEQTDGLAAFEATVAAQYGNH